MLVTNFVNIAANVFLLGFLVRMFQKTFPDSTVAKALAIIW